MKTEREKHAKSSLWAEVTVIVTSLLFPQGLQSPNQSMLYLVCANMGSPPSKSSLHLYPSLYLFISCPLHTVVACGSQVDKHFLCFSCKRFWNSWMWQILMQLYCCIYIVKILQIQCIFSSNDGYLGKIITKTKNILTCFKNWGIHNTELICNC